MYIMKHKRSRYRYKSIGRKETGGKETAEFLRNRARGVKMNEKLEIY